MADYRAAIIGCGNIAGKWNDDPSIKNALTHARALEMHPQTTLVACCDTDSTRAEAFSRRWGLRNWYLSVGELLSREEIDIVSICVPTHYHREIVAKIMEALPGAGRLQLVLLEKPVAATMADTMAIATDLDSAGLACSVNYIRRFDRVLQSVKHIISSLEMGAAQQFRARYTKGLLNNGSHLVNLLRFYFGDISHWDILDSFQECANDSTVSLFITFKNGVRGTIQGLKEECYSIFDLDVMLEQGVVSILDFGNRIEVMRVGSDTVYPSYRVLQREPVRVNTDLGNAVYHYLDNSINSLEGIEVLLSPLADAVEDVIFCNAVREAL